MAKDEIFDTLRLSDADIRALLDELLSREADHVTNPRRSARRGAIPLQRISVKIRSQQGDEIRISAVPRNLSRTGMGCLTGRFIHTGTACAIQINDASGRPRTITGTAVRCLHVSGRVHEFGVRFDKEIDASAFVVDEVEHARFEREHVDLSELEGTLLYVDDQQLDIGLIRMYLDGSKVELLTASNEREAQEMLASAPDMVLVDQDLGDTLGADLIAWARRTGFHAPMIMITALDDPELRFAAIAAGADDLICKPVSELLVHQVVAEYISIKRDRGDDGSAGNAAPPDSAFLAHLQSAVDSIEAQRRSNDVDGLVRTLRSLTATGAGFGFPAISEAAANLVEQVQRGPAQLDECGAELDLLIRLCANSKAA